MPFLIEICTIDFFTQFTLINTDFSGLYGDPKILNFKIIRIVIKNFF